MILIITSMENCVGCRACEYACPQHCIKMEPNQEGFMYPSVDQSVCINCGVCKNHCPQNINLIRNNTVKTYAAILNDKESLRESSSGGAFTALAFASIEDNAIVCGTQWDKNLQAIQTSAENRDGISKMRGSKYVQSDTNGIYKEVKFQLDNGRRVLYTGTPCQVAGLYAFLGKEYEDLTTTEIICHGVPSPALFQGYIEWLKENSKDDVVDYNFRSKKYGWGTFVSNYISAFTFKEHKQPKYLEAGLIAYYDQFLKGENYRECCYTCKYSVPGRVADLTIGDYWGVESAHKNLKCRDGVSLILVNTENGRKILQKASRYLKLIESSIEIAKCGNHNLVEPTRRPEKRDKIYKEFAQKGYIAFVNMNPIKKFKSYVKLFVPYKLRGTIRRLKVGAKIDREKL